MSDYNKINLKADFTIVIVLGFLLGFFYLLCVYTEKKNFINKQVNKFDKAKIILIQENKSDTIEIGEGACIVNQNDNTFVIFSNDNK